MPNKKKVIKRLSKIIKKYGKKNTLQNEKNILTKGCFNRETNFDKITKISGPISFSILQLGNKKVFIYGDEHFSKKRDCGPEHVSITGFIDLMIKKFPKIKFDLFVEAVIPKMKDLIDNDINYDKYYGNIHYLDELRNYSEQNYKKKQNLNFHFVDIRQSIDDRPIMIAVNNYFDNSFKLLDLFGAVEKFKKDINYMNIFNLFDGFLSFVSASIYVINYRETYKIFNVYTSQRLLKEVKKLYEFNKDYYKVIKEEILPILSQFIYDVNRISILSSEEKALDKMYSLLMEGIYAGCVIMDTYLLCRLLKNPKHLNNIIYAGETHTNFITQVLKKIGFEEIYSGKPESKENFRCMQIDIEKIKEILK